MMPIVNTLTAAKKLNMPSGNTAPKPVQISVIRIFKISK